jgi:hypothetical protein
MTAPRITGDPATGKDWIGDWRLDGRHRAVSPTRRKTAATK